MKTKLLLCFLVLLSLQYSISAQTHVWTGNGGDTNWNNPNNWDVLSVPDSTSDVLISGIVTVDINNTNTIHSIIIEEYAILNINGSLTTLYGIWLRWHAKINLVGTLQNIGYRIYLQFSGAEFNIYGTLILETEMFSTGSTTTNMFSGEIQGSGYIINYGDLIFRGIDEKNIDQITIDNYGTIEIIDSEVIDLSNGVIINNFSEILIDSSGGIIQQNAQDATINNNNNGFIFFINNGISNNFYMILDMNNHAYINIEENQTFLFLTTSANFINFENGVLGGSGTFDITSNFTNQGNIDPGLYNAEPGTLYYINNFHFPSEATLHIDIYNTIEYDTLYIFGSPDIDGTIEVSQDNIEVGDEFTIITSSQPLTCNLPSEIFASGANFDVICNTNSVILIATDVYTLGNEEVSAVKNSFFSSPNPSKDVISFKYSDTLLQENSAISIELYTVFGEKITEIPVTSENTNLEASQLASGLYFAQLVSENKILASTKIVIE